MPYTRCPKCGKEQYTTHAMLGLTVPCKSCGREYLTKEEAETEPEPLVPSESPFGDSPVSNIAKSAGFLILLIAIVGLVFWGIISLIRPATPKAVDKKGPEVQGVEDKNAARNPADRPVRGLEQDAEFERATRRAVVSWVFVILVVFYAGYLGAIWYGGYWLAGDTAARGYSPLVWVGTYAVSQLFGRGIGYSLLAICYYSPLEAALLAALLSFALSELFSWAVFLIWLKVRPLGRLETCSQCSRGKLQYVAKCPTCGSKE